MSSEPLAELGSAPGYRWRVNAGLYGKAKAVASGDSAPISGTFSGTISNVAPKATIAPNGHTVIDTHR